MPRINTNDAAEYIAALTPFSSNGAIMGALVPGGNYQVNSYGTPIALIDTAREICHLNGEKYSRTTSKHQHETRLAARSLERRGYEIVEWDALDFEEATGLHARAGRRA